MLKKQSRSDYGAQTYRKQTLKTALLVVLILVLLSCSAVLVSGWIDNPGKTAKKEITELWDTQNYSQVFVKSREELERNPVDTQLLTLYGFAAYQLAAAQINASDMLSYIDECIWSLRKALLTRDGKQDSRIHYVLGKAYYFKGPSYADLAVQYLEQARGASYSAPDIPEYLGLSYALMKDYRSSVAAFSLALSSAFLSEGDGKTPDSLLLAIATSYMELGEFNAAKAYLIRCIESSPDSNAVIRSRLLLGKVFQETGDMESAEKQYKDILELTDEHAEAHFQLGEIYGASGDTTRARAEWRRALWVDPAHETARSRLNMR
ncbi:tetratricopeptide repeat protein [Treponema sp. OttesenSCG-928-L16]|nr:tetratricopeptide repeat protein [Treponema sp. OttesenSCG-928-L16]